ncbi:MAG: homoserine dehydrogenase [Clostridiales bacterium]|nr:homoserine dehydrogenase [Clostridiales bacterium]
MYNVAILGFGVVGAGTAEVLSSNRDIIKSRCGEDISITHILDIRDFPGSPFESVITKNADDVFEDPDLDLCIETIGGARIAYEFTKRALSKGISVVTSNKELVSTKGPELLKIAEENSCSYLFEAAVGGGIPIIRPLYRCLAANKVIRICGIVNGTTNYILSSMKDKGISYDEALKQAQANGYAEADPTADVEGIDAQRKLSILSTIAMNGIYVSPDEIETEGISSVSLDDIKYADSIGCQIKLIAYFERIGDRCAAFVKPHFVNRDRMIGNVDDVFNAVMVEGDFVGETLFYGRGAGSLPTASAVAGDVIELAACKKSEFVQPWSVPASSVVVPFDEVKSSYIFWSIGDNSAFNGIDTVKLGDAVIINGITSGHAIELASKASSSVMNYL